MRIIQLIFYSIITLNSSIELIGQQPSKKRYNCFYIGVGKSNNTNHKLPQSDIVSFANGVDIPLTDGYDDLWGNSWGLGFEHGFNNRISLSIATSHTKVNANKSFSAVVGSNQNYTIVNIPRNYRLNLSTYHLLALIDLLRKSKVDIKLGTGITVFNSELNYISYTETVIRPDKTFYLAEIAYTDKKTIGVGASLALRATLHIKRHFCFQFEGNYTLHKNDGIKSLTAGIGYRL